MQLLISKTTKVNVIAEEGRRITPKHIRQMEKAGLTKIEVPAEYLVGRVLGKALVDESTGEVVAECNAEITSDLIEQIVKRD